MPDSSYSLEIVKTDADLARLEADWDRLSRQATEPNVFTTFDWFQVWNQEFVCGVAAERLHTHVLALRQAGRLTGVTPLIRVTTQRAGLSFRRLQFALHDDEWDYNDLVVGEDGPKQIEAVAELLQKTAKDWEIVDLKNLRADGNTMEQIGGALRRAGLHYTALPTAERCPYLILDGTWEEMLSRRSGTARHAFRNRKSRLLRTLGEGLRMRIIEDPRCEPGLLERMIALEAQKHVDGKLSVPFVGRHAGAFSTLFDKLGPKGWLCVALMEWNDRLLSWHLLFRCGGKLWGYLTAYDHEFARLSPGSMLVPSIIDYGRERGCTEYDFLGGDESYKAQWAMSFHERQRLLIWNGRWKSRLYAAAYRKLRMTVHVPTAIQEQV